jgi:hypothetical protein
VVRQLFGKPAGPRIAIYRREFSSEALERMEKVMLYTIAVVLLILWLLGLVSGYTVGAFIHVLLVVALVLFLVGLLGGRRVV